ncbi:MAG: sigma-70 family RNA polymerase sigma factor [Planctomycetota bacterium]
MADLPETRQSLLIELGRRNDAAWEQFLAVYERAILRYCTALGLQETEAQDAAQAVYSVLHRKMSSWDHDPGKGSFRAWLFRVARNVTLDQLAAKAKAAMGTGETRMIQLMSQLKDHRSATPISGIAGEEPNSEFDREMQRALFEWACSQVQTEVRPVTWQAFFLTAVGGKKADEAAEELGIPIGSVYTAKCRVMARIREHVAAWRQSNP